MNKYKSVKTEVNGIKFASKAEAVRYKDLCLLEHAGEIRTLMLQVPFILEANGGPILMKSERYKNGRKAKYVADFVYKDVASGKVIIEDKKGKRTELYLLKRAIMESMGHVIFET